MDVVAVRELFDTTLRADPPPMADVERIWFDGHCQSKFHTGVWTVGDEGGDADFAEKLAVPTARFNAENRLYLFALTSPSSASGVLAAVR